MGALGRPVELWSKSPLFSGSAARTGGSMRVEWVLAAAAVAAVVAVVVAAPALAGLLSPPRQRSLQGPRAWDAAPPCERGLPARWRGAVRISEEYRSAVVNVLKSDPDTSKLLSEGYNVTAVRPLVTAVVTGRGEVVLRADRAVVLLKGPSGHAWALVDVSEGKVLKVVTVSVLKKA